jgi:aryl-alcohol dehydrogenase-like predicted oxidoreductase
MKLALGTAQLGMTYGITNQSKNRVVDLEAEKILQVAYSHGFHHLDTAAAYGDSELLLGTLLNRNTHLNFNIVTKTLPIRLPQISKENIEQVVNTVHQSKKKLKCTQLYGLMIHDANDLLVPGSEQLFSSLIELKEQGHILKIGCSFYNPTELLSVLDRFPLDMVQIPMNLFDQRFANYIDRLQNMDIETYVRSIFLQGLLLSNIDQLNSINMSAAKPYFEKLDTYSKKHSVSSFDLIFSLMKNYESCYFLMGFNQSSELEEVMHHMRSAQYCSTDLSSLSVQDENIINPTKWKKL